MKLSIITINKDNAEGLQKTLDSVACQTWHDFEHIIVDGASADRSVDIIRNYAADVHPYPINWLSEPDTGIYNAMNKGIRMANGEYCMFLNSGDYLYAENVLESVFDKKCKSDIFYGNYYTSSGDLRSGCIEEEVTCFTFFDYTIHHSGCSFIKKELFYKYGLYDEDLKIVADWKWFLQAIGLGTATVEKIDVILSVYDLNGVSTIQEASRISEREQVIKNNVPPLVYRDYKRFYELIDENLERERQIRKSWAYRIGYFIIAPIKWIHKLRTKSFKSSII